mgnify:CR=1 FL=1
MVLGSSFFLVSSILTTLFPYLALSGSLWTWLPGIPEDYLILIICLWSTAIFSFYLAHSISSGEEGVLFMAPVPAILSCFLWWLMGLTLMGITVLVGGSFCAISFIIFFEDVKNEQPPRFRWV